MRKVVAHNGGEMAVEKREADSIYARVGKALDSAS